LYIQYGNNLHIQCPTLNYKFFRSPKKLPPQVSLGTILFKKVGLLTFIMFYIVFYLYHYVSIEIHILSFPSRDKHQ